MSPANSIAANIHAIAYAFWFPVLPVHIHDTKILGITANRVGLMPAHSMAASIHKYK